MSEENTIKHYAEGLYLLAVEENSNESFYNDLKFVNSVFKDDPKIVQFLDSPLILAANKKKILHDAFSEKINKNVLNFIFLLIDDSLIRYFNRIVREYRHLLNKDLGIVEGKIFTPFPLTDEQQKKIEEKFKKKFKKDVQFKIVIDKRLIAGIKIIINSTLYDYSADTKINAIKNNLLQK